jgi:P4 family phage/plasmid primase-like protien
MEKLRLFLETYTCKDGEESNVTSLDGKWGGKWLIPLMEYDRFLSLYYSAVSFHCLRLVEKKRNIQESFHMFADIDISKSDVIKYFPDTKTLPPNFLHSIITEYTNVLKQTIVLPPDTEPKPIITCRLKDESSKCHLNWPNIIVNNKIGRMIRDIVCQNLAGKHNGDWNKWLDVASYTCTGLRMLGSVKRKETRDERYYVCSGFDLDNKPIQPVMKLSLEDIKRTSIRHYDTTHTLCSLTPLAVTHLEIYNLSSKVQAKPKLEIKCKGNAIVCNNHTDIISTSRDLSDLSFDEAYTLAQSNGENSTLSNLLSTTIQEAFTRSWNTTNYDAKMLKSFKVGKIKKYGNYFFMHNDNKMDCVFKGSPHSRETSCHYHGLCTEGTYLGCHDELCKSKRYPDPPIPLPLEIKNIIYMNNTFNNNNILVTCGDHQESSVELDFINDTQYVAPYTDPDKDKVLLKALNGGDGDVACLLHLCCNDKFYYDKSSGWWYYDGNRWQKDGDLELSSALFNDVTDIIRKAKDCYLQVRNNNNSIRDLDKKIIQIDRVCKRLNTSEYKTKIKSEAKWVFNQKKTVNLETLLDSNPYLIGFQNGVYDLSQMLFRESKCNDYISLSTGYDYVDTIDAVAEKELELFLESIMPDDNDRQYLLKLLSSGLIGRNDNELFHIFTGAGRNGKSKLAELVKLTLGEYFSVFSSSFLTSKFGASEQASPQLMSLNKVRLAMGSEPDHNSKLNATLIKSLSGNDTITGRKLYGEQQTFKPVFKIILLCNNIPEIDSSDNAVWMRCRVLPFPTSFVANPVLSHEKTIDLHLAHKIPNWRLPFFRLLLKYYQLYEKDGLEITPNMKIRTKEYQTDSDSILHWLNERTEVSETHIHTVMLYDDFKAWFYHTCPGKKSLIQKDFINGLKQYKEVRRTIWANGSSKQGVPNLQLKKEILTETTP